MRKTFNFLLTLLAGFVIFGAVIGTVGLQSIFEAFFFFLSPKGLLIFILGLASLFLGFYKWRFVLKKVTGLKDFKNLNKVWFAGFTMTYLLTPFAALGGEPFRVYMAKKLYGLSWKKTVASVIIERFLDWTVFLILTIPGVFIVVFYGDFSPTKIIVFAVLLLLFLAGLLIFFYSKALKKESVIERFLDIFGFKKEKFGDNGNGGNGKENVIMETEKETLLFLSPKKKKFWQGIGLSFVKYLFLYLRVGIAVYFLTGAKNPLSHFAIFGFSNLALLFPTPATLGSLEAVSVLSFKFMGLNAGAGPVFAMVLRGADVLISLIGAIFLAKFTLKITKGKIFSFIDKVSKSGGKERI